MSKEKKPSKRKPFKIAALLLIISLLSACGSDYPKLTHFKAFDERFTTVIDTKNPDELKEFSAMFFERTEADDALADLSFDYLFDITTAAGSERWRCTKNGYCQQRTQGAVSQLDIYYVERYKELYEKANLN
ncbi:hypothetical protein OS175_14700 [Marinicella sp. S1101]|uniref:hypothetical protein n=1 Tax=Marinicella marina TaxID=2996016 RepID=UPI002260B451|nr:hypothetical protein [Marinicella marina]MCX7555124.1 hypothetical protein [Marinicella marina]MDJ1140333.1 hypothetical protein [Marinicella marina]